MRILTTILFLMPSLAIAALPPVAESLRKIRAVAESPAVYERLGTTDQVTGITATKEGYVITTNRCRLKVAIQETNLKDIEPSLIGPPKLEVVVTDVKCQKRR